MNIFSLKNRIMIGVYMLFVLRKLKSPVFLEIFILFLSVFAVSSMVSLNHVLANTPKNVPGFYHFLVRAFFDTEITVKLVSIVVLAVVGIIAKNTTSFVYVNTNKLFART